MTVPPVESNDAAPSPTSKPSFDGQPLLDAGLTLIPLNGKVPRDKKWQLNDYDSRAELASAEGHRNLGVNLTGSGWLVVDVDPRNFKGDDSLAKLVADAGLDVAEYPAVQTGGGGLHVYMRLPDGFEAVTHHDRYPGIEFKSSGQVVAPGSIHPGTGKPYVAVNMGLLSLEIPANQAILAIIKRRCKAHDDGGSERAGELTPRMLKGNLDQLRADDFPHDPWLELMMAAHHATNGEGREEFIEWSTQAAGYADHGELVGKRWDSLQVGAGGVMVATLFKRVIEAGGTPFDKADAADDFEEYVPTDAELKAMKRAEDRWTFLTLEDMEQLPPPQWLVDGFIQEETLVAIYGAPESGKSFLAIDMAMSVASDRRWHGRDVMPGAVLYIAAEGAMGLSKRVRAWRAERGVNGAAPFHLMRQNLNLTDSKEATAFCRVMGEKLGALRMIVIDTLNQTASGADENSAQDMGRYIESMKRLRDESGAAVVVIHHSGKDASKGLRGSTALLGGFDTTIEVVRPNLDGPAVNVRVRKQKDAEKEKPIGFDMVQLGDSLVLRVTKDSIRETDEAFIASPVRDWAAQQVLERGGRMSFKALLEARMDLTLGKESKTRNELKAVLIEGYDSAKATPCSDGSIVWLVRQAGNTRGELEVHAKEGSHD